MADAQYNGSQDGMPDCRHRSIMFRLANNGSVLLQFSDKIPAPDFSNQVIYPVRYYFIEHKWFVTARLKSQKVFHQASGGPRPPWPDALHLTELQSAEGQRNILEMLRSHLLTDSEFMTAWQQDVKNDFLIQSHQNEPYKARIWSAEGRTEQFWDADQYELRVMRQKLDALNRGPAAFNRDEICLGSVSNWPPMASTGSAMGSSRSTSGPSSMVSDLLFSCFLSHPGMLNRFTQSQANTVVLSDCPSYHLIDSTIGYRVTANLGLDQEMRRVWPSATSM
jgi:hypothetical protein